MAVKVDQIDASRINIVLGPATMVRFEVERLTVNQVTLPSKVPFLSSAIAEEVEPHSPHALGGMILF